MSSLVFCTPHLILCVHKIEKNEMGGACTACWGVVGVYRVLVEKPEGQIPVRRPTHKWENDNKTGCQDVGCLGNGLD